MVGSSEHTAAVSGGPSLPLELPLSCPQCKTLRESHTDGTGFLYDWCHRCHYDFPVPPRHPQGDHAIEPARFWLAKWEARCAA